MFGSITKICKAMNGIYGKNIELPPTTPDGEQFNFDEWLASPERVLSHFRVSPWDDEGVTAREINRRRWGSYVPVSVDVEDLKACKRRGLVRYEKGKWFLLHNDQIKLWKN